MTGGGGGPFYGILPKNNSLNILFLLGILNSSLFGRFVSHKSTPMRGGYIRFSKQYIKDFPIRAIDFNNKKDKAMHDRMVTFVDAMLELNKKLRQAKTPHDRELIERRIKATDNRIDRLVYELYGLTDEEVRVVEGS